MGELNDNIYIKYPSIYENIEIDKTNKKIIKNRNSFIEDYHIKEQSTNNFFLNHVTSPLKLFNIEVYDSYFCGEKILVTHFNNITNIDIKKLLSDNWLLYPYLKNKNYTSLIKKIYLSTKSL